MKTQPIRTFVAGLILAASFNLNPFLHAADSPLQDAPPAAADTSASETPAGLRKLPFHGKLAAVDAEAKTITLRYTTGDKVFHLTPQTEVLKHEKPAKLDEAVIGDSVSGAYVRNGERAELTKLNLARKADDKPKAEKKDKAKSK